MAEFNVKCPHCNAELAAEEEWIGMTVECPSCKENFTVTPAVFPPVPPIAKWDGSSENRGTGDSPTLLDKIVGGFIAMLGASDWDRLNGNWRKMAVSGGSLMFVVLGLAFCIGGFVLASKQERPMHILMGVCIFLTCVFLAYLGEQLFKLGDCAIQRNCNRISSVRLLNCFFIFFFFTALGVLIAGIYLAYKAKDIQQFYSYFVVAFSLFATSILALNPQLINLHIDDSASGDDDWVSIIQFFVKGNLFILPYYWVLTLTILGINLIVRLGADESVLVANFTGTIPQMAIVGLSPLGSYLLFLGISFILNISKEILSVPNGLDQIAQACVAADGEKR